MVKVGDLWRHDEHATGFDTEKYSHTADVRLYNSIGSVSLGKLRLRREDEKLDFFPSDAILALFEGTSEVWYRAFGCREYAENWISHRFLSALEPKE